MTKTHQLLLKFCSVPVANVLLGIWYAVLIISVFVLGGETLEEFIYLKY